MFIKIEDIGPEGVVLSEPVPADTIAAWLDTGAIFRPAGDGSARAEVSWAGQNIVVRGTVSATLAADCSLCLKGMTERYEVPFTVLFAERLSGAQAEESREGEEGEYVFFGGPIIELDDVLRDNLVVNLPMAPRCSEECKGLCPSCGRDLNLGRCACAGVSSPLAAAMLNKGIFNQTPEDTGKPRRTQSARASGGSGLVPRSGAQLRRVAGKVERRTPSKKGGRIGTPKTKKVPRPPR